MSAASYAGIPLALLATTAYNVGLILEKRALGRMPTIDMRRVPRVIASLLTSRAWLAGFTLMLTGLGCQTIVLTFEPVSIVQPVLASGVALVLVLSRLVLRERLGGAETWCVVAIAVSVVLLALSATGTSTEAGHHASPGWMAAVMIPSIIVGVLVATRSLHARSSKHGAPATGVCFGIGTGLLYGVGSLAIKALSGILAGHHSAVGIVAGVASSPYLYTLAGSMAVAMLLFQAALQACRASIVVPGRAGAHHAVPAGTGARLRPSRGQHRDGAQFRGRREETVMALEHALLDILVCPIDKRGLLYFADDGVLYNPRLRRLYRIENGIPLMVPRQAVPVPDEEHNRLMKCARRGEVTTITAGQDDVLTGTDLARQPVHGQPGLIHQHDRAG